MASALSREMELMETQLNRCMEAAREAVSLREEASSLVALLKTKVCDHYPCRSQGRYHLSCFDESYKGWKELHLKFP